MNILLEHKQQSFSKALQARKDANAQREDAPANDRNDSNYMSFMSCNAEAQGAIDAIAESDDGTHKFVTITYAGAIAVLACYLNDLSIIFGFFGACAEAFNDFFLPSILLFCALKYKRYNKPCLKTVVTIWFGIGCSFCALSNYYNFKKVGLIS
jgi:hypothetical protein